MREQGGELKAMDGDVGGAGGDGTRWWWALASAAQFGWGISSFTKGYDGDSSHKPLKAFAVASLFVGCPASAYVAVLQSYGIRKVDNVVRFIYLLEVGFMRKIKILVD